METYGIISLLPVAVVIVTAIISKRTVEPLILGALVGYIIVFKQNFFTEVLNGFSTVVSDNAWYVLVFGFFGMVIALLEKSGGALGFGDWGSKVAKTQGATILATWILGILVFIDDYLNNLGVGTAMRNISDKNKISRELMAYTINSTGAAVCVLVPMSSWAIFMMSQYDKLGVTIDGSSLTAYIHTVPFMFYAWVAVILVPLIGFKVVPTFGAMKKAQERALAGDVFPASYHEKHTTEMEGYTEVKKTNPWNFIVPLIVLIAVTLIVNDILVGMASGFVVCFLIYIPQKLMTVGEFCDTSLEGFKSMVLVTAIVISAFVLQEANAQLGLTEFVISVAEPVLSAKVLPVMTFIICAFIAMCTGSYWGTMAIAAPILIPLAGTVGADPILVMGAIVSAGAFGSHACFYGDAVTLASAVTGITNMDYAKTTLPILVIPTVAAIILFLVFGFVL